MDFKYFQKSEGFINQPYLFDNGKTSSGFY